MHLRLACARCGAALVPAFTGLRCPRLAACGFGGHVETLHHASFARASAGHAEA